jgi:hypothetical protein
VDAAPDTIKCAWTRGRIFPLCVAVIVVVICVLLFGVGSSWQPGKIAHIVRIVGPVDIVLLVVGVALPITLALRRKAVLTSETLIVRNLFRTHRLPLRDITAIERQRHTDGRFHWVDAVVLRTSGRKTVETMALGWSYEDAVRVIAVAVGQAGGNPDVTA